MLEAVVRARAAAVVCAEAPVWSLSDSEVSAAIATVHATEQAMLAAKLHLVRELDARGAAVGGAVPWLSERLRMSAAATRRLVALARAVDARPGVDDAITAGRMDAEQATVVSTTLDELPVEVGPEVVAKAAEMLIEWAGEFAAPALRKLGARVLAHVAPEVAEEAEARHLARQEERAHTARTVALQAIGEGRYRLSGVLDTEAAAVVTAALDPLCAPRHTRAAAGSTLGSVLGSEPGSVQSFTSGSAQGFAPASASSFVPEFGPASAPASAPFSTSISAPGSVADPLAVVDERSPGQRRADALVDVCRLALATAQLPANGGDRPQLTVTVAYDPLVRALGAGTLDTGERISPSQTRRLACDAHVMPAVLGGAGQVLDVGQSRRLITGALRRALTLRDGGCAFPGCDRPPRWCDGHHIRSWVDGGPTSLDNAVLLCGRHHRVIHHGDWSVRLTSDGLPTFVPPAHIDPSRRPRRNIFHDRQ